MNRKIVKLRKDGSVKLNLNPDQFTLFVKLLGQVRLGQPESQDESPFTLAAFHLMDAIEQEIGTEGVNDAFDAIIFEQQITDENDQVVGLFTEATLSSFTLTAYASH